MGIPRFITYKTKSEQSEWKIHDPMIYACSCGERDIPFFYHYFMPFFVIDRVGNCIIPSAAYHISCKITVKQLVESQIR